MIDADQQLVGVIHFRDLRDVVFDPLLSKLITAVDVADESSKTVLADTPIEDVLSEFRGGDVGSLPVIEGGVSRKVVGIVEQRDVLRALHDQQTHEAGSDTGLGLGSLGAACRLTLERSSLCGRVSRFESFRFAAVLSCGVA